MFKKTLLVINGSEALLEFSRRILERAEYSVYCAEGIAGAREHLMDHTPDGVILDNEVADGNAMHFCRELRDELGVPVLFMSGDTSDELPALMAGASDFLKRTSDYNIVKARIRIMLNAKTASSGIEDVPVDGDNGVKQIDIPEMTNEPDEFELDYGLARQQSQQGARADFVRIPWLSVVATVLCVLIVIIGLVTLYSHERNLPDITIFDGDVPLGTPLLPDENATPYLGDAINTIAGSGCQLPYYERVTASSGDVSVTMVLFNPGCNARSIIFEIILDETGEVIFESGLVAPGMCIEDVRLLKPLSEGEYNCTLIMHIYDTSSLKRISKATDTFVLSVH